MVAKLTQTGGGQKKYEKRAGWHVKIQRDASTGLLIISAGAGSQDN